MGWIALSVALAAGLGWAWWQIRKLQASQRAYRGHLAIAAPLAMQHVANVGPLATLEAFDDYELLERHGDEEGIFSGLGNCPCRQFYTANPTERQLNGWQPQDKKAATAQCDNNPPPVKPPDAGMCSSDCVPVLTHRWFGWSAWRDKKTQQVFFRCVSFGQYHCKKPDDPDRNKPPLPHHPKHPADE